MKIKLFKKIKPAYYWVSGIFICTAILFSSISSRKSGIIQNVKVVIKPLSEGEFLVTEKDILNTIESKYGSSVDGLGIREIDVQKIEIIAEKNPFVKDAEVYIDARNRLCINIQQNNPILRIFDKFGNTFYIDKDLKYFPSSRHGSPRLLIANGNIEPFDSATVASGKHIINKLVTITKEIQDNQFALSNTEQLYVDQDHDIILVPKIGSQKFILGDESRIEEKLEYVRIYYKNIASTEGWKKHSYVNLKFDGQIVCN